MLDLYDEHAILRKQASNHRNQFSMFIPSDWKIGFDRLAIKKVLPAPKLQSFIRQFVKAKVIRECFLVQQNADIYSLDVSFHVLIPKAWLKKQVSKLFRNLSRSNSRADFLRKSIAQACIPLENATSTAKYLPYA